MLEDQAGIICIGTSWNLQLGSYHWHKSKTVEGLKLNLVEHLMKHLQILKLDLQLQLEFYGLSYQVPFIGPLESCWCTLRCQNLSKCYHYEMTEIYLLNGNFWSQIDICRKCCYHLRISLFVREQPFQWLSKVITSFCGIHVSQNL